MGNAKRENRRLLAHLLAIGGLVTLGLAAGPNAPPAVASVVEVAYGASSDSAASDTSSTSWDLESGAKDIVRMGENIEIAVADTVDGDVVAIGGSVTVRGHVLGDVVSIGGGIDLKSGCMVKGDVVSVGGRVHREEGTIVRGQNVSVGVFPKVFGPWLPHAGIKEIHHRAGSAMRILGDLLCYIGFFVIGLVLYLAFPERMGIVRQTNRSRFWLSLVVGFASLIGVAAILVLLCITCIGILVAIPGAFLYLVAIVAGGAVAISLLGEVILRRPVTTRRSWAYTFAFGLGLLFVVQLLGRLLCCTGDSGLTHVMGHSFLAIVKTAWFVLLMTGFGGLVLSRLGKRVGLEPAAAVGPPWGPAGSPPTAPPPAPVSSPSP